MRRIIIATFVAIGIAGTIPAPAFAHKPGATATTEQPFPPKDFWDQQKLLGE